MTDIDWLAGRGYTMIPLVDIHCHLLAGLDDGARTEEEAIDMCRFAYAEGVRMVAATAHQNQDWASVTPDRIRQAWDSRLESLARVAAAHPSLGPEFAEMIRAWGRLP